MKTSSTASILALRRSSGSRPCRRVAHASAVLATLIRIAPSSAATPRRRPPHRRAAWSIGQAHPRHRCDNRGYTSAPLRRETPVVLRSVLTSVLFAACGLLASAPGLAQSPQQQDIAQGEHCLRQMERDPQGAVEQARRLLAPQEAGDLLRMMALACLVRGQLMTGEGEAAGASIPELLQLLDSVRMPQQLRVEMRLYTATALQELGQVRQAGEVLNGALAESGPYTNQHLQALVAVALH